LIDSELEVENVKFIYPDGDGIKQDTLGIHMVYSKLKLHNNVRFIGPGVANKSYITKVRQGTDMKEINGAFIAAHMNSEIESIDTTFEGGRGTLGGCVHLSGDSQADFTGGSFKYCAAMQGGAIYASNHVYLKINNVLF
jgi:hypothetical protein